LFLLVPLIGGAVNVGMDYYSGNLQPGSLGSILGSFTTGAISSLPYMVPGANLAAAGALSGMLHTLVNGMITGNSANIGERTLIAGAVGFGLGKAMPGLLSMTGRMAGGAANWVMNRVAPKIAPRLGSRLPKPPVPSSRQVQSREIELRAEDAVEAGANAADDFFAGTRYSDKVNQQMLQGDLHAFPENIRTFQSSGTVSTIIGGDKVPRTMLEIRGSYMGRDGAFQFIKESDGTITHRFFRPDSVGK
jgi:hypothetical protein